MPSELNLRDALAAAARTLHSRGWVANHDGNLTARLGVVGPPPPSKTARPARPERFLATPTAISKGDVRAEMLLVVDALGEVLEGRRRPFGELDVHLACYRARPDVSVVCHAHPVGATAFGAAGLPLAPLPLPEMVVSLGAGVPSVPLLAPRSPELIQAVEQVAARTDAFLVEGNGVFTLGNTIEQAVLRMELVEHAAQILLAARQLGGARPLPTALVDRLLAQRPKR